MIQNSNTLMLLKKKREVINLRVVMAMPMLIPAPMRILLMATMRFHLNRWNQTSQKLPKRCLWSNLSFNDFCGQDLIPEHQNIAALQTIRTQRGEACGVFDDILPGVCETCNVLVTCRFNYH